MNAKHFLSLLLCLLLMVSAAMTVNKSIFGHSLVKSEKEISATDSVAPIENVADGTVIIHTGSLTDVSGYGGQVPLDITLKDGKISSIVAPDNSESPSFFERAEKLFDGWIGKTPEEALSVKADAVSGATYSSNAIIANVNAGLSTYLESPGSSRAFSMDWKLWIALIVTLVACVIPLFVKNRVYNNIQLIANIVVLGFWCGQFLDYTLMLRYLSGGIPMPVGLTAIAMLAAAFIYPLFGRPQHYCNHICPLGSAQILMAQICHFKIKMTPAVIKFLDWFRRILWAVLMLCLWADVWTSWMDLELFQAFMVQSAPVGIIIVAVVFVLLSAIISRPYCRFVCPTGSLFKRSENIG